MTAKHFRKLAASLAAVRPTDNTTTEYLAWAQSCIVTADVCASQNPRFDRDRFATACLAEVR